MKAGKEEFRKNHSVHHEKEVSTMKGNQELIKMLNFLLADELTAISQYIVHSEMNAN